MRTRDQGHTADSSDEDALVQVGEGEFTVDRGGNLERSKWRCAPLGASRANSEGKENVFQHRDGII